MTRHAQDPSLSEMNTHLDRLCHFQLAASLPADASLLPAKNGTPTLLVGRRHIHSAFDPQREAERIAGQHRQAAAGVLFGYGCGHVALAWHASAPRPLLVVECRPDLLPAGRSTADQLPPGSGMFFARAEGGRPLEEDVLRFIRSLPASSLKSLAWMDTPGAVALDPPSWERARAAVKKIISDFMTNLYTELEFERLWFANILTNAGLLAQNGRLASMAGCLAGRSVLIVGAGPGLDRWLGWLREARRHAVILAVDTALKPLVSAGILPHAVISLDGQIHNLHDFTGVDTHKLTLLCDISVYPAIPRLPFARRIFFETADIIEQDGRLAVISHPLTLWCKQAVGELGAARSGGNVGTSAIELARIFGAGRILLVGCDHAWPGGLTHAREAPAMQRLRWRETRTMTAAGVLRSAAARRATFAGMDYDGKPVLSDIILAKYAAWTSAAYAEACHEPGAGQQPEWATLSREGLVLEGIPALKTADEASQFIGFENLPEDVFPVHAPTASDHEGLSSRLRLLADATGHVLARCTPLPPLEDVLELFARFPFLRRGYGAQVLHADKTGNADWLLGEVRFQLEKIRRILTRCGY